MRSWLRAVGASDLFRLIWAALVGYHTLRRGLIFVTAAERDSIVDREGRTHPRERLLGGTWTRA